MRLVFYLAMVLMPLAVHPVWGLPVIDVGDHELLPDTPGQVVQLFVSGGDPVQGLNFNVQVAGGGPTVEDVDILQGTIFDGNNTGTFDLDGPSPDPWPLWEFRSTTTASGTVSADGLLATLVLDTTGLSVGAWDLMVSNTQNGPTDFAGTPALIIDGSLTIGGGPFAPVPEPSALFLILPAGLGLLAWRAAHCCRAAANRRIGGDPSRGT